MGVGRPAGETLYFGRIAAAVLENSQHSILFVSVLTGIRLELKLGMKIAD
jgi:hypothetical protein